MDSRFVWIETVRITLKPDENRGSFHFQNTLQRKIDFLWLAVVGFVQFSRVSSAFSHRIAILREFHSPQSQPKWKGAIEFSVLFYSYRFALEIYISVCFVSCPFEPEKFVAIKFKIYYISFGFGAHNRPSPMVRICTTWLNSNKQPHTYTSM